MSQPSVKSVYKTNHFTNIKQTYEGLNKKYDGSEVVTIVVVCSLTSIQEARGKRSNHLLVSLSAIAQDKTKAIKTQFRNCT